MGIGVVCGGLGGPSGHCFAAVQRGVCVCVRACVRVVKESCAGAGGVRTRNIWVQKDLGASLHKTGQLCCSVGYNREHVCCVLEFTACKRERWKHTIRRHGGRRMEKYDYDAGYV